MFKFKNPLLRDYERLEKKKKEANILCGKELLKENELIIRNGISDTMAKHSTKNIFLFARVISQDGIQTIEIYAAAYQYVTTYGCPADSLLVNMTVPASFNVLDVLVAFNHAARKRIRASFPNLENQHVWSLTKEALVPSEETKDY